MKKTISAPGTGLRQNIAFARSFAGFAFYYFYYRTPVCVR